MSDYEGEYEPLWHLEIQVSQEFKDDIDDLPISKQRNLLELLLLLSTIYPETIHVHNFTQATKFDGHLSGTRRLTHTTSGYF